MWSGETRLPIAPRAPSPGPPCILAGRSAPPLRRAAPAQACRPQCSHRLHRSPPHRCCVWQTARDPPPAPRARPAMVQAAARRPDPPQPSSSVCTCSSAAGPHGKLGARSGSQQREFTARRPPTRRLRPWVRHGPWRVATAPRRSRERVTVRTPRFPLQSNGATTRVSERDHGRVPQGQAVAVRARGARTQRPITPAAGQHHR